MRGFKSVQFSTALAISRGGYLNKEYPLVSKQIKIPGHEQTETYVHVKPKDPWLTQVVMGKAFRGVLFPGVLTDLHDLVVAAEKRLRPGLLEAEEEEEE